MRLTPTRRVTTFYIHPRTGFGISSVGVRFAYEIPHLLLSNICAIIRVSPEDLKSLAERGNQQAWQAKTRNQILIGGTTVSAPASPQAPRVSAKSSAAPAHK